MHTRLRHDRYRGCGMPAAAALVQVLLVEDDPDVALMERLFADRQVATELHHVAGGDEALAFLHREGGHADMPRPDPIRSCQP